MTWANRITIFRIVLIPIFLGTLLYYSASERHGAPDERLRWLAFGIFLVAAISDGVDGYLARHCNQRTKLGAVLDPTADKLLAFTALLSLSLIPFQGIPTFPLWFPLLVISRDVILAVGAFLLHYFHHTVEVRPHWTGKVSTVFVFAAICAVLLNLPWVNILCWIGGLFTLASTVFYVRDGIAQFNAGDHSKPH
ncbi:CDP-diacylglycerol--glycerol-3-phosphate 3-phosphatidyltransferase/cardiolipin synthase [Verrucomicrobium sp. GAS474]|uniref:CDP-alcohol phosphatidyltransferase family protein n=1 Tax=Verrucomicrobium sp. GAS474 TaxID=1882831 RepID=UPI00087B062F|nr:CDP-alcohol phosphatidyltransferase family protein [Verrucomicrobium sp. GAS474]SDT95897.1 CDP-diacylglycerol--glycerol-3-phosphate 3-phosphatidyltransferase/cardiolipin synthase [Verrucomicrobium sp. GAS474]